MQRTALALAASLLALLPLLAAPATAIPTTDEETSPMDCGTTNVISTVCVQAFARAHVDCFKVSSTLVRCTGYVDVSYTVVTPAGIGGSFTWDRSAIGMYCGTEGSHPGGNCDLTGGAIHDDPVPSTSPGITTTWGVQTSTKVFTHAEHYDLPVRSLAVNSVADCLQRWVAASSNIQAEDALGGFASTFATAEVYDIAFW